MSETDIDGFLRAFAAAAVNGHADAVVTHNVSDFAPASARLGVRVLTPAQLLKELSKP